jgi:hypothetical protein
VGARVDGPGYDIRSFDPQTGAELLIEVKTTAGGPSTAYFFTDNELRVSREEADRYRLYRVYDFGDDPSYFVLELVRSTGRTSPGRASYSAHPQLAPRDQPSRCPEVGHRARPERRPPAAGSQRQLPEQSGMSMQPVEVVHRRRSFS